MWHRILVVLSAAALHVHAVVLRIPADSAEGEPTEEAGPFDDFFHHDDVDFFNRSQWTPVSGPKAGSRMAKPKWVPPPRDGEFPFPGPGSSPRWGNRLLIAPQMRLAFCQIEKNACTQFNRLLNGLNGIRTGARPFGKSNWEGKYKNYFEKGLDSISKARGWSMTVFVREPAERFLSAWLSKCDAWEYGGLDCLGPQISDLPMSKKVEAFERTVVELLPPYMARSRMSGSFNAHYDPQHTFCGGRAASEYDFVGVLEGSPAHISRQVLHMLEVHANISQADPLMALAERLFPKSDRAGHGTGATDLIRTFYRNHTILEMVMEQYAEDYEWAGPEVRAAWTRSRR